MPFWKQSDDPWDRKPGKRPARSKESQESFIENLKAWHEERKALDAARAAPDLPPEKCPWCGRDMEQGYLVGSRGVTRWYPGRLTAKAAWIGRWDVQGLTVLDEDNFIHYKTTWLCRECKKMVFDAPNLEDKDTAAGIGKTKEEEESGE